MKRILSLILVAVLCLGVLTSCEQVGGIWDTVSGTVGGWLGIETPEEDTGLSAADVYLHNLYGKKDGSSVTNDFDVVGRVPAGNGKFLNVAWTCDDDSIVIRESTTAGFFTVDLPAANAEEFDFTLTATITDEKGETKTRSYTFTMLKVDNTVIVTEPTEGVDYKLFLTQGTLGKRLYALATTQNGENKFINTTTKPQDGVIFNAEKVDGGYKFYTTVDGVKNYVYANTTVDGTKVSKYIGFNTEEGSVFTYNADMGGVWTVSIEGNTYGVGTYGSYNTICISDASFFSTSSVGSSQFVLQIVTAEYANSQTEDADLPTYKDAAEILNLLYVLEDGKTMAGNFYLTGKITALDSYGNPTIVVEGFEDKPVLCYKLTDERFVEGATISVYAKVLKNYKGTYELEQCEVKSFLAPSEGGEATDTYGVVTELKTGDHVLIGNPSNGKLLSANKTGYYNLGVDYTADNFSQVTDAEIWVVTVNDDGSYSFTSLTGEKLGMADEFSSFNSDGPHFNWTIEAKDGANGIFYIKNTVRGNYIEWYADKGNWSSYTNPNSDLYELSFYVKGATGSDTPVDPQPPHEHNFVEGKCECGETDPNYQPPTVDPEGNEIVFDFGANGAAGTHTDGNDIGTTKSFTSGNYTLELTDAYKAYVGGFDKAGNSILKFGTSSVAGTVTFVVPENVTSVIIYAARYKSYADNNIIVVNGTSYTLTANSDDGQYEAITVDTTTNKTVTIASSTSAAKPRCVVNNIVWILGEGGSDTPVEPPHEHNFVEGKCECGETDPNYQPPHEHNFVEGKCECGEEDPNYVPPTVDPETPEQTKGGSADFDTLLPGSNGSSSYTTSYTTTDGWVINNSAIQAGGTTDMNPQFTVIGPDNSHKAICMNGKVSAPGAITSPTLAGGVSKITINYTKIFTDTELSFDVIVTNLATGEKQTYNVAKTLDKNEKYVVYTAEIVLDTAIAGEFTIELVNKCPTGNTGNKDRTTILSIDWE